jgi:hypothetical protein
MSYVEITPQEYQKYQMKWAKAVPTDIQGTLEARHFKHNDGWVYGYEFGQNLIDLLKEIQLTNPDFRQIVFRFVIDNNDLVKLVLFGIDGNSNHPLTGYYLLTNPLTQPLEVEVVAEQGNLPAGRISNQEASEWSSHWNKLALENANLDAILFKVFNAGDSTLQNYTYAIKDAIPSIPADAYIYFTVHKHPGARNTAIEGRNLFSILIHWDNKLQADTFYNMSVPCPPCCPRCE